MTKHVVNVPEYTLARDRRRMTAGQWLTEFGLRGKGRLRIYKFTSPVFLIFDQGAGREAERFGESIRLFRRLYELTAADAVLISVRSDDWSLSPKGLFTLNHALRTPAVRKGGLNIVRHFLENRRGARTPLRGDFDALLSFLEIRPVFRVKTAKTAKPKTRKIRAS